MNYLADAKRNKETKQKQKKRQGSREINLILINYILNWTYNAIKLYNDNFIVFFIRNVLDVYLN